MNPKEREAGQKILAQIEERYNNTETLLRLAQEQHTVDGMLIRQLAMMYAEPKPKEQKKNE